MIAVVVAMLVNLLIAIAIELVWRRRREASHARTWTYAFALAGIGWGVVAWTSVLGLGSEPSGAAAALCWLAAALLFVHGLRQRAGRPGGPGALAAIWVGVAFGIALLLDVGRTQAALVYAGVPFLSAMGLLLAAVAVGPRGARWHWLDLTAALLLAGVAMVQFAFAGLRLLEPRDAQIVLAATPIAAIPVFVALGLAVMLLLNDDLTAALHRLARIDPLTGVWNRRGFEEGAARMIATLAASPERIASVAIADIDSFKAINDKYGHSAGDAALVRFARQMREAAHRGDLLARLGGEEFALLAIGVEGTALVERMERARQRVAVPDGENAASIAMTASFGVAQLGMRTLSLREALERADQALYRAKQSGKNQTILAEPMRD